MILYLRGSISPALMLLALSWVAARGGVIYSTGFEPPTYTVGPPLFGQDGWVTFSTIGFVVENSTVKTGSQAAGASFTGTGLPGTATAEHTFSWTDPLIDLSADIFFANGSIQSDWDFFVVGPFTPPLFPFLHPVFGIDVLANNTFVLASSAGSSRTGTWNRNAWNHVDFLDQHDLSDVQFLLEWRLDRFQRATYPFQQFCGL